MVVGSQIGSRRGGQIGTAATAVHGLRRRGQIWAVGTPILGELGYRLWWVLHFGWSASPLAFVGERCTGGRSPAGPPGRAGHLAVVSEIWPGRGLTTVNSGTRGRPVSSVGEPEPPEVSPADTVDELVKVSKRKGTFALRRTFLQPDGDHEGQEAPLAALVRSGDLRALQLYLLLLTKASAPPWDSALSATAWARALGYPLPDSKTSRSTISKIWLRLQRHNLIERKRTRRLAHVYLLREDGSGAEYTSPGEVGDRYFKVPLALWKAGPDESSRWYQVFTLPELAVLLIALSLSDGFRLPQEKGPSWYGVSSDTISRGTNGLQSHGLLHVDKVFKKAPLSPVGYTAEHRYTLQPPFGPVGRRGATKVPKKPKKVAKKAKEVAKKTFPRSLKRKS